MSHKIELEPVPGERGDRTVKVNGEVWARFYCHGHGCHGTSYKLSAGAGVPVGEDYISNKGTRWERKRFRQVEVWGDKSYRRANNKWRDDPIPPLADRLKAAVADAIEKGWLKSPEARKAEATEESARYRAARAEREREKRETFEARAREALAAPDRLAAIVEAMEWAQSQ